MSEIRFTKHPDVLFVSQADFDACAKAAVEMARIIQDRMRAVNHLADTLPDYQRAQAIIDQYGGQP